MILGVILAGGRSVRMGREKAFVPLAGTPLIGHAVARLAPQVDRLVINANGDAARFAAIGVEVLPDATALFGMGPIAGIITGLVAAAARRASLIATAPCDAPLLPLDLVARLQAAAGPGAIALGEGPHGVEPAFGLWPVACLPALLAAAESGEHSLRGAAARSGPLVRVRWTAAGDDPDPFLNLNRPADVAALERRLAARSLAPPKSPSD